MYFEKFTYISNFQLKMESFNYQPATSSGFSNIPSGQITQDGENTFYNLTPSRSVNTSCSNTSHPNSNPKPAPSFMKVFDIELVGQNPLVIPDRFQKGIHPEWLFSYGTYQFVEPMGSANSNKSIAYWDMYYNRPYFYGRGFLFRNPSVPGDYCFKFDPESQPFKSEPTKGMIYLTCKMFCSLK